MRNPLTPIRNGIEVVRSAVQDNPLLDRVTSMMRRQCEQLICLIDDLLDVSRINQGKLHLRRRTMTVAEAVDTAVEAVRPLIVDVADSLRDFLEIKGHEVTSFNDGQSALEALAGLRPDVVLCDVGMPGMSGLEVARQVRKRGPEGIFLVSLSGYGTEADIRDSLAAGFDLHLVKPVDPLLLLQILSRVLKPAPAPREPLSDRRRVKSGVL